jgi:hypothetical protein
VNKKILITFAVIGLTLATVKTGYAFYEKQNNLTEKNETLNAREIVVNTEEENIVETKTSYVAENTAEDSTAANQASNCCGSSYGSMLDENGNFKDRDTYEKELDEYVASGELTEEDKEYYLFLYDKCAGAYANSDTESGSEDFNTPSCH